MNPAATLLVLLAVVAVGVVLAVLAPRLREHSERRELTRRSDVRAARADRDAARMESRTYRDGMERIREVVRTYEDAWPEAAQLVRHELNTTERAVAALPPSPNA